LSGYDDPEILPYSTPHICPIGADPGHDSVADYAEEIIEETVEIPEPLRFYIDFQSMARDMELNGDIFTVEQGDQVHIFANH
jgi:antirestriction protein